MEVIDGILHKGDRVTACSSGDNYDILEVGFLSSFRSTLFGNSLRPAYLHSLDYVACIAVSAEPQAFSRPVPCAVPETAYSCMRRQDGYHPD